MSYSIRIDFDDHMTDKDFVEAANLLATLAERLPNYEGVETFSDGRISTDNLNAWSPVEWVDGEDEASGEAS